MAACRTCANPQVDAVNTLIAAGTPIRAVARMFGVPRSSLARHASHIQPLPRRLGVVPAPPIDLAPVDPLEEALQLAERARTERERLKALEQIRAATTLKIRGQRGDPGAEATELLDRNVHQAEEAYRLGSGGFEATVRALQGLREALRQRLDAVKPKDVDVRIVVTFTGPDGAELPPTEADRYSAWTMTLEEYFRGTPARFHDADTFIVRRVIPLSFHGKGALPEEVNVFEIDGGPVWTNRKENAR